MNNPKKRWNLSAANADAIVAAALRQRETRRSEIMGVNKETGEVTEATWERDQAADEEHAADLRWLDDMDREREDQPHYEVRATCAGCGTELIVEIPQPYCDDCK